MPARPPATLEDHRNSLVDLLGRVEPEPSFSPSPPTGRRPERGRSALDTAVRAARRRIVVLLVCVLVVPVAAYVYSSTQTKQYTATANLLLRDLNLDQKLFNTSSFSASADPQRDANTNLKLIGLRAVAARTAAAVGGVTAGEVQSMIAIAPSGQSDLVDIAATGPDPKLDARVANAFASQYISFRREADRSQVQSAQTLIQKRLSQLSPGEQQSAAGQQLARQIQQLNVLAALQTGNAELVQTAGVPTIPSAPHPKRNAIVGLLAGLLLGAALVFLLERLDQRLKEREDVEDAFGLPVLTMLPETRAMGGRDHDPIVHGPETEAFALLRTSLRFYNVERRVRSVVVTSPAPGDGKTTVALNLAAAAARAGEEVLLIEADLRRPQLANRLELAPSPGLSGVLAQGDRLLRGIVSVSIGEHQLDVLPAGPIPPNPAQLLESDNMRDLLAEAERLFDLVVIDTPPTSSVPDTLPLMSWASAVLVVCRLGRTKRGSAALVRQQLDSTTAAPLGIVLNGAKSSGLDYYAYRSAEPAAR